MIRVKKLKSIIFDYHPSLARDLLRPLKKIPKNCKILTKRVFTCSQIVSGLTLFPKVNLPKGPCDRVDPLNQLRYVRLGCSKPQIYDIRSPKDIRKNL